MEKTNKIYIVGTLTEIKDERTGEKDGVKWIAGTAVVQSGDNELELKFYSPALTKAKKENVKFANYESLATRIGERVKVNGDLNGRLWFNDTQGQVINFNELSAGFFNVPRADEVDICEFEFGGFVVKPLHERLDQQEKLIGYEMEIGQVNYRGDNMQIVRFFVDPSSQKAISGIQNAYLKNTTVFVKGNLRYEVVLEEKTEEVAFGDPIVKKYRNVRKSFVITTGKEPITDDGMAYSPAQIASLEAAYSAYSAGLEKDAKNKSQAGETVITKAPAASNNQDRFL